MDDDPLSGWRHLLSIVLSASVMVHPQRLHRAREIASELTGVEARLALDPEPRGERGTLRTAIAAWSSAATSSTHHLVVQDDILPRQDFVPSALKAIASKPDVMWCFYCNWNSKAATVMRIAAIRDCGSFESLRDEYAPALAVVMPSEHARQFAAYATRAGDRQTADDILLATYARESRLPIWQTVPNLVDHEDNDSLAGSGEQGRRRAAYIDEQLDFDPLKPSLSAYRLPYFPMVRLDSKVELLSYIDGDLDGALLENVIDRIGLTEREARDLCRADVSGVRRGRLDTSVAAALEQHAWSLWLMGAAYGSLASSQGVAKGSSRARLRLLWESLVHGSAYQSAAAPPAVILGSLVDLIQLAFDRTAIQGAA